MKCFYMFWIRDIEVLAGGKKFESLGKNGLDIDLDINFSDGKEVCQSCPKDFA